MNDRDARRRPGAVRELLSWAWQGAFEAPGRRRDRQACGVSRVPKGFFLSGFGLLTSPAAGRFLMVENSDDFRFVLVRTGRKSWIGWPLGMGSA